jgi:SprT-like protein
MLHFTEEELQALAETYSQRFWGSPCLIPVVWNGRLTKTMGRFMFRKKKKGPTEALSIELSKHAARSLNEKQFAAVLLHELCHYHMFRQGLPFEDHHPEFEKELKRVGAISTNTLRIPQKGFKLYCSKCEAYLGQRKRLNLDRYKSQCCHAPLIKKDMWFR